jgi:hypothetical protein
VLGADDGEAASAGGARTRDLRCRGVQVNDVSALFTENAFQPADIDRAERAPQKRQWAIVRATAFVYA